MKTLLCLFTSILLPLGASFAAEPPAETPVVKLAHEIRLPKVEFRDATVQESIDFLKQKSVAQDPKKQGVNIALAGQIVSDSKITLSLTEASVFDILQVIAGQAGLDLQAGETVIMLVPKAK